jgi:hypothetical protein
MPMVNLIDKAILDAVTDMPDPRAIWDATENLHAYFYVTHGVFPRYLYVNEEVWETQLRWFMGHKVEAMGLTVIDSPFMPKDRVSLHYEYHPHREIAKWHASFSEDEGIESGRLELV